MTALFGEQTVSSQSKCFAESAKEEEALDIEGVAGLTKWRFEVRTLRVACSGWRHRELRTRNSDPT